MSSFHQIQYFYYQELADNSVSFDGGGLELNESRRNKKIF